MTKDPAEATTWYRLAAEQAHAPAQVKVGHAFANGVGVPKDRILAYMWYSVAVPRFALTEKAQKADAERLRDEIGATLSAEELAEAQRHAREWTPRRSTVAPR